MSTIAVNTITPATGSSVSIPSFVPAAQFGWVNKIINGDMTIAQRGTSFAAAVNGAYTLDRWLFSNVATTAVVTVSQQTDVPSSNEFLNSLRAAVTTADTSIGATEITNLQQRVEGYNARDLIGRTFTLSFWVRSSKTGTHCVSLRNSGLDRSYVAEYSISAANTWEYKTITVSGGLITAGTWNWTNGEGLRLTFTLAAGSDSQTTAGAWQTGNFLATSSQVNCLDTIGNIFAITGVQLEAGSVATPFEHRPIGAELALCQRYYYKIFPNATASQLTVSGIAANTTTASGMTGQFPVTMRVAPTALEQSGTAAHYRVNHPGIATATLSSVPTFGSVTNDSFFGVGGVVASGLTAGYPIFLQTNNVAAYLAWSAEL